MADAVSSSVVRLTLSVFWFGLVKRVKSVSVAWYSARFMQASEARDVLRSSSRIPGHVLDLGLCAPTLSR